MQIRNELRSIPLWGVKYYPFSRYGVIRATCSQLKARDEGVWHVEVTKDNIGKRTVTVQRFKIGKNAKQTSSRDQYLGQGFFDGSGSDGLYASAESGDIQEGHSSTCNDIRLSGNRPVRKKRAKRCRKVSYYKAARDTYQNKKV